MTEPLDIAKLLQNADDRISNRSGSGLADDTETILRLAQMDPLEYDRCRETEASRLNIRVRVLDTEVQAQRKSSRRRKASNGHAPPLPPRFSDDALALTFSARYDGALLYVPAWSAWLRWDDTRWAKDDVLTVYSLARVICREAASDAAMDRDGEETAKGITSAATIAAVERLARSDPRQARSPDIFDADPWILNTPGGIVDLKTGKLRAHKPEDMVTKVAGATPGGDCERFLAFLKEITQNNQELIDYLQRFIGYTLTGSIQEHAFLFAYGPGGNGKGVLFSIIEAIMGDYATTAMHDVFTAARNEQHSTNLAALRGARMVAVTETEEGRQWAEARVKAFTGDDKISARVMRGDPVEFSPVCKLWFSGNHKPPLRNPDAAMRRRMNLVPLNYVQPTRDPGLLDALKEELPGILAWAIQGCLNWQEKKGLHPPEVVSKSTDNYFTEQNAIALWVDECCGRLPTAETASRKLFNGWKAWSLARGDDPGSETRFSMEMEKSFAKEKKKTGMVFKGIAFPTPDKKDGES